MSVGALLLLPSLISGVSFQPPPVHAALQDVQPQSAAGDLDASFGDGGKVTTDFSGSDDLATCVAIQSDGKIVVGGASIPGGGVSDGNLVEVTTYLR